MSDIEEWTHRAECGGTCGHVIWVDTPTAVICLCGESAIEPDGTLTGSAKPANAGKMRAFIKSDHGRTVSLQKRARK